MLSSSSGIGNSTNDHWASSGLAPRTPPTSAVVLEAITRLSAKPGIPAGKNAHKRGKFGKRSEYQPRTVGKMNSAEPTQVCQVLPINAAETKMNKKSRIESAMYFCATLGSATLVGLMKFNRAG